jgi:hypothetical protein
MGTLLMIPQYSALIQERIRALSGSARPGRPGKKPPSGRASITRPADPVPGSTPPPLCLTLLYLSSMQAQAPCARAMRARCLKPSGRDFADGSSLRVETNPAEKPEFFGFVNAFACYPIGLFDAPRCSTARRRLGIVQLPWGSR